MKNPNKVLCKLNKLEPLDLQKCHSVSDIVVGMEKTAFTARCLGKCTRELDAWMSDAKRKSYIISDGLTSLALYGLMESMVERKWFEDICTSVEYLNRRDKKSSDRLLVIGDYDARVALKLHTTADDIVFINQYHKARTGQAEDGDFNNVVFADPEYVLPIMYCALLERYTGVAKSVTDLVCLLQNGNLILPENFCGLAEEVVNGAHVLHRMATDKRCNRKFLTLSGAMTIAKMQLVACDTIETIGFDMVASTGALMAHGFIEGIGDDHYEWDPSIPDAVLAKYGLNRVTDSLEPETNFDHLDKVMNEVLDSFLGRAWLCPSMIHDAMGKWHKEHYPDKRGILRLAHERKIPVIVPAFHDSEIGNDVVVHNRFLKQRGFPRIMIDQEADTEKLVQLMDDADRPGIFSIGGGAPRNTVQNVGPLREIITARGAARLKPKKFYYGCKIDPTPNVLGSLGAATYKEMKSWRKAYLTGVFAEIHACATIVWPFLTKYVMEKG